MFGMRRQSTYVHDTTVDVSKFLEPKEPRPMCRVIESKALDQSAAITAQVGDIEEPTVVE